MLERKLPIGGFDLVLGACLRNSEDLQHSRLLMT